MTLETLKDKAAAIGARAVKAVIRDLIDRARAELPKDVAVEPREDGISLAAKALRKRLISDVRLRAFGLWAKGFLR
jgi:hypothetical protein